jgi:hypothetical protein
VSDEQQNEPLPIQESDTSPEERLQALEGRLVDLESRLAQFQHNKLVSEATISAQSESIQAVFAALSNLQNLPSKAS